MKNPTVMKNILLAILVAFTLFSCEKVVEIEEEIVKTSSFKEDFKTAWERSRIYTLALADSMPEELYAYKPAKDVFTFSKQLTHTIDFAGGQLVGNGLAESSPFKGKKWEEMSKAEVRTSLNEMYDWVESLSQSLPDSTLEKEVNFFGNPAPAWRIFQAIENHTIHHRGQALVYMRLKGITPPGYAGW